MNYNNFNLDLSNRIVSFNNNFFSIEEDENNKCDFDDELNKKHKFYQLKNLK